MVGVTCSLGAVFPTTMTSSMDSRRKITVITLLILEIV